MAGLVTLCCWDRPNSSDYNLMKIVKFLGGNVKTIALANGNGRDECFAGPNGNRRLVISASTLRNLVQFDKHSTQAVFRNFGGHVLVFDCGPEHSALIKELTNGALTEAVLFRGPGRVSVSNERREHCRQFSGLSFNRPETGAQPVFTRGAQGRGVDCLLSVNEQPFFIAMQQANAAWMMLASSGVANLDAGVPRDAGILTYFEKLVPVMMFLFGTSHGEFWQNPAPEACFIVDDPLLRQRYGFLEFKRLIEEMQREQFCTSIAFIPWNFSRSHPRIANLFAARGSGLSLSVHGCDHTGGEFGATDLRLLQLKAHKAEQRMRMHRKLSGVDFDPVMVFPQGVFSTTAMQALKACGYLAAVNTTAYPVDALEPLTLRDLIQPAVTRYSRFPLFTRRYPQSLPELAFDLFVGKPALVVEHHGYFRDGYQPLSETVNSLRKLDSRLRWSNLGSICSRTCLQKHDGRKQTHLKFYTSRFCFRNETTERRAYVLVAAAHALSDIRQALVNGQRVEAFDGSEGVQISVPLEPGQSAEVRIDTQRNRMQKVAPPRNRVYEAKVFLRRSLCELRDNFLDRSALLARSARSRARVTRAPAIKSA